MKYTSSLVVVLVVGRGRNKTEGCAFWQLDERTEKGKRDRKEPLLPWVERQARRLRQEFNNPTSADIVADGPTT
jgi:hypothetical protein